MKALLILAENSWKTDLSGCAPFHMKTRVSLKYLVSHCRLKYDKYCQGYIHFSNKRHKKITPSYEKVLTLQKPVWILKIKDAELADEF